MHRHFRIFFSLAHAITLMIEWSMYCVRKKVILTGSDTEACDCSYNTIKITLKYQKYFLMEKKSDIRRNHTHKRLLISYYIQKAKKSPLFQPVK